jgi:hypothetical protein
MDGHNLLIMPSFYVLAKNAESGGFLEKANNILLLLERWSK